MLNKQYFMIKYLKNNEINKTKWDETIKKSRSQVIYGYSWYLDNVFPGWHALVENDYETIMPLPVKKKLCISYVFQPFLSQQLGIFSTKKISTAKIAEFFDNIPQHIKLLNINLNITNYNLPPDLKIKWKTNLILCLNKPYEELFKNYHRIRKRSIKKAYDEKLKVTEKIDIKTFLNFVKKNLPYNVRLSKTQYKTAERLYEYLKINNKLNLAACISSDELIYGVLAAIVTDHRVTLSLFASNTEGKNKNAPSLLIDYFIRKFSNKEIILDFAGSSVENIKFFFKTFNPIEIRYPVAFMSKIPFLKFYKKI